MTEDNMQFLTRLCAATIVLAAVSPGVPRAALFTDLFVFGDSLVDTGNDFLLTGGLVPPADQPYAAGRFSNGALWIDNLAAGLGLSASAAPFLAGGNNYAFGGARTGVDFVPPGLLLQVGLLYGLGNAAADPNALYVITAGGNDLRDARGAASTAASRQAAAEATAVNVLGSIFYLADRGARNVLLSNAPDLGITPEAAALGLAAQSTDIALRYNAIIGSFEAPLEALFPGLDIDVLDIFSWSAALYDDTVDNGGAIFGLTNATTPCAGFTGSTGISCDVSMFSDDLHPSAATGTLFGMVALDLVQQTDTPMAAASFDSTAFASPFLAGAQQAALRVALAATDVPEPGTALLLGGVLLGGIGLRGTRFGRRGRGKRERVAYG